MSPCKKTQSYYEEFDLPKARSQKKCKTFAFKKLISEQKVAKACCLKKGTKAQQNSSFYATNSDPQKLCPHLSFLDPSRC